MSQEERGYEPASNPYNGNLFPGQEGWRVVYRPILSGEQIIVGLDSLFSGEIRQAVGLVLESFRFTYSTLLTIGGIVDRNGSLMQDPDGLTEQAAVGAGVFVHAEGKLRFLVIGGGSIGGIHAVQAIGSARILVTRFREDQPGYVPQDTFWLARNGSMDIKILAELGWRMGTNGDLNQGNLRSAVTQHIADETLVTLALSLLIPQDRIFHWRAPS